MKRLQYAILLLALVLSVPVAASAEPPRKSVGKVSYWTAQEGEDLLAIAHRNRLAIDHLTFANGWPQTATRIYPETPVVLPTVRILPKEPPRDGIVINLPERMLFFFQKGQLVELMPVSIGAIGQYQTPTGEYRVNDMARDPIWYPPSWAKEKGPVGPGPDNPLGDRWIGLTLPRFGIHSTYQPWNVGHNVTHGCLRAYPDMLRELYPKVRVGMPVSLQYETVKVGKDGQGRVFMLAYPDAYKKVNPVVRGKKMAAELGYSLSPEQLKALDDTTGLPIWLDEAPASTSDGTTD